jgi:trk system potassium uptake protein TrkA
VHVLVLGCGRTGSALAARLEAQGDHVVVVDADPLAAGRLPRRFSGRFVQGNGMSRRVLESAGVAEAEALVAFTPNDSANAVAARVAREEFRVPRVIARLHEPDRAEIYRELGIRTVATVETTVNRVVRSLHHPALEPQQSFGNDETFLVRSPVPAYLTGRALAELEVPGEIRVVEVSRGGHSRVADEATLLEAGDLVSFVVAAGSLGRLRSFLSGAWSQ